MIENVLAELAAAVKELTATLAGISQLPGTVPTEAKPTTKPEKPAKADKPAKAEKPAKDPDFDEIDEEDLIVQITDTVKAAITSAEDPDEVKAKWTAVRKRFKVEKISDLRGRPVDLAEALIEAKKL